MLSTYMENIYNGNKMVIAKTVIGNQKNIIISYGYYINIDIVMEFSEEVFKLLKYYYENFKNINYIISLPNGVSYNIDIEKFKEKDGKYIIILDYKLL